MLLISDLTQSESGKEPADEEEEENVDSESADEDRNDVNKCSEARKKNFRSEKQVTVSFYSYFIYK